MRAEFGLVLVDEGREDPDTTNAPISPRIILVPRVPNPYFWLIGRMSAKTIENNRELAENHLEGLAQWAQS